MRTGAPPRVPLDLGQLREWSRLGWSVAMMSRALGGVCEESIRRAMRDNGVPRRPAHSGAPMERNYFWRGGRIVDKHGYILVKTPGHPFATKAGYVREHRLVMERILGRYLEPHEVVDHVDGNTSNNDPTNLRLFASNADHLRATLTGKCPKWTEDGRARIREGARLSNARRTASRLASKTDVDQ
jgi:hypothetical protein